MNKVLAGLAFFTVAWVVVAATAADPAKPAPKSSTGLHITDGTRFTAWPCRLTDGEKFLWDLQQNGAVNGGTNNAYGGALYLNLNGNSFMSGNGLLSKSGDEIELGPWSPDGRLRVSRRIKVYKDRPLARWLDIYENTSGAEIRIQPQSYVNNSWNIARILSSTGGNSFGDKDWAVATQVLPGFNPNPPAVCHIVCGKNSKVRPTVSIQNNTVQIAWNLTVPPNSTAIVAQFESQSGSIESHQKMMAAWQPTKAFRDLPASVRRLIVNFASIGGLEDVDLQRSDKHDTVILANGDELHGKVLNASYEVEGLFGKLTLAADQVIGMANPPADADRVRFLLKDGQVVCGCVGEQKLQVQLLAGPTMQVPLARIGQWSYAVTEGRPSDAPPAVNMVMLRTGDRLAFDPKSLALTLRTLYGPVELDAASVARVVMDNTGNCLHRAAFVNGSSLAGLLEPEQIRLPLKLGPRLDLSRHLVSEIVLAPEQPPGRPMAKIVMSNGDELLGQLAEGKLTIRTDFGPVAVEPRTLKALSFAAGNPQRAILDLWDGTSGLRGDLSSQEFCFQMTPGPTVKLPMGQVAAFRAPYQVPPQEQMSNVGQLVKQLGSDSFKERQAATDELIRLGPGVIPLLEPRLQDGDFEVRQRVEAIIERLKKGLLSSNSFFCKQMRPRLCC